MTDREKAKAFDDIARRFACRTGATLSDSGAPLPTLTLNFTSRIAAGERLDALTAAEACRRCRPICR